MLTGLVPHCIETLATFLVVDEPCTEAESFSHVWFNLKLFKAVEFNCMFSVALGEAT